MGLTRVSKQQIDQALHLPPQLRSAPLRLLNQTLLRTNPPTLNLGQPSLNQAPPEQNSFEGASQRSPLTNKRHQTHQASPTLLSLAIMPPGTESSYSNEEEDEGIIAVQAQQRAIQKLKKVRDERAAKFLKDFDVARKELQATAEAYHEEQRRQRAKVKAGLIADLAKSVQRRKEMEDKIGNIALQKQADMEKVEEMLLAGYDGREAEVRSLMNKGPAKRA